MKKLVTVLLLMSLMLQLASPINGVTDNDILSDPISNTYSATNLGPALIRNLTFSDVGAGFWAQDPITRLGSLDIVKGYNEGNNRRFRPEQAVTQEEALAFLLRVIGQEEAAQQAALALEDQPVGQATLTLWSKGYIAVANQLGVIADEELIDFVGNTPATREKVAKWIVDIVNAQVPETLQPLYTQQLVFNYSDWENMASAYIPYIEAVGQAQIMVGDGIAFRPKSSLTRAEMAQIIKNMGEILYKTKGLSLKSGIVGFVREDVETTGLQNTGSRTLLVRNDSGKIDAFVVKAAIGSTTGSLVEDAVVLSERAVTGLRSLKEGDVIEYLVEDATAELKYVQVKGSDIKVTVTGILEPLERFGEGMLTIKNAADITFSYKLADGLYNNETGTLKINDTHYPVTSAPVTNKVALTLQNNLITGITYEGDLIASNEITGIITEINTQFAYISLVTWDGKKVTKYYQKNGVIVEKQSFYEGADTIGYVDELFPDFRFDSQDTSIDALDVGDIVYLQLNPNNTTYATRIRAKTNYIVKYGLIQELVDYGAEGIRARVEYSDNSVGLVTIDGTVPVMKGRINVKTTGILVGQVVRMLVNQGVVEPGIILEKVMAVEIDPYGNKVKEVYRGELGNMNTSQSTLSLRNSYVLAKLGWSNYSQSRTLNVDKNTAYFYNDKQISLAYADTYLRTATMQTYVVTGETFGKERILRVVFRDGRSTVLAHSNIIKTDGQSEISLLSQATPYRMDAASIVIKNGYLVSVQNIFSPDYAQVALGGSREAAVINIVAEPTTSALTVFRGRLQSVELDLAFNVHSHAILKDMTWIYSPIERAFELDYRTVLINEEGIIPMNQFLDYSDITKVDEVYTIIAKGTTAQYIVANPYVQEGVMGEIYSVAPEQLMIKDVLVYNMDLKTWNELSLKNSYGQVDLLAHSMILKNNEVVSVNQLEIGDKIRVMTTENMSEKLKLGNERDVVGYIIFVEK